MVGRAVMPRSRKPSEPPGCVGAIPTPSANSLTLNERKSHEICYSLSKSVALSQELQTKSCHSNPTGEVEPLRFMRNTGGRDLARRCVCDDFRCDFKKGICGGLADTILRISKKSGDGGHSRARSEFKVSKPADGKIPSRF